MFLFERSRILPNVSKEARSNLVLIGLHHFLQLNVPGTQEVFVH